MEELSIRELHKIVMDKVKAESLLAPAQIMAINVNEYSSIYLLMELLAEIKGLREDLKKSTEEVAEPPLEEIIKEEKKTSKTTKK